MSELLSAAAAALGLPEPLVQRSAAARAAETGASVDDVLSAWAEGGDVPSSAAAPADEPEDAEAKEEAEPKEAEAEPEEEAEPKEPEEEAEEEADIPAAPTAPARPPVLVGAEDNPMKALAAVVGLFLLVLMVGLVGPSMPIDSPGERTSEIEFSEPAQHGLTLYAGLGCASCHTQMVRPVIADVGLGAATLNDTNQVIGVRRFGPDLASVGSRLTGNEIAELATGARGHPPSGLSGDELTALVAYLSESVSGG